MNNHKHFFKIESKFKSADILADRLAQKLGLGGSVLWLISGGSAIEIAVLAAKKLSGAELSRLSISLVDERYGPVGHSDSNWRQLTAAGFELEGANLQPILENQNPEVTAANFEKFIGAHAHDYKIALLGMGADGHTAGILPGSPALTAPGLVCFYQGPDYQRLTLSRKGLESLDEAILFASGENKHQAVKDLSADLPPDEQPAQIIKQIPRWSVYNDLLGEEL
jgi:6-phosphogluconolactonase